MKHLSVIKLVCLESNLAEILCFMKFLNSFATAVPLRRRYLLLISFVCCPFKLSKQVPSLALPPPSVGRTIRMIVD